MDFFILFSLCALKSNQEEPLSIFASAGSDVQSRISDFFRWRLMAVYWSNAYKMSISGKAVFSFLPFNCLTLNAAVFLLLLFAKDKKRSGDTSRCTINGISSFGWTIEISLDLLLAPHLQGTQAFVWENKEDRLVWFSYGGRGWWDAGMRRDEAPLGSLVLGVRPGPILSGSHIRRSGRRLWIEPDDKNRGRSLCTRLQMSRSFPVLFAPPSDTLPRAQ